MAFFLILCDGLSISKCQRGLTDQKSRHAPFLMQIVFILYLEVGGKVWGRGVVVVGQLSTLEI